MNPTKQHGLFYNTYFFLKKAIAFEQKKIYFASNGWPKTSKKHRLPSKFRTTDADVHFRDCKHCFSTTLSILGLSNLK